MTATLQRRPRTSAESITLRTNYGSHRRVQDVLAFDAIGGVVFVRFEPRFRSDEPVSERVMLTELEALDADGRYVRNVGDVVRSMVESELVFE